MVNKNALKSKLVLFGLTSDSAAECIGINRITFSRKMSGTSEFTCGEIFSLIKMLNLSNEEVMTIFFTDKVS